MKLNISLTIRYLFLFIFLIMVGNGGFTHSSSDIPKPLPEGNVASGLPLFVKVPSFEHFNLFQVNPYFFREKRFEMPSAVEEYKIMTRGACSVFCFGPVPSASQSIARLRKGEKYCRAVFTRSQSRGSEP